MYTSHIERHVGPFGPQLLDRVAFLRQHTKSSADILINALVGSASPRSKHREIRPTLDSARVRRRTDNRELIEDEWSSSRLPQETKCYGGLTNWCNMEHTNVNYRTAA